MGRYTYAEAVPFCVRGIIEESSLYDIEDLDNPTNIELLLFVSQAVDVAVDSEELDIEKYSLGSWNYTGATSNDLQLTEEIYAYEWSNGEHSVFIINESEYASVGEHELTVFAYTKEALVAFMTEISPLIDYEWDGKVAKNKALKQTI